MQTWSCQTNKEFRDAAEEFKNAPTRAEAEHIFKKTGVQWSELLRLPYWDPTRFVAVDPMHNLFLSMIQYHICQVLQLKDVTEMTPVNATP
jgi:hypothetical protein